MPREVAPGGAAASAAGH